MYRYLKRFLDIVFSLVGILALLPLFIIVIIVLKFTGVRNVFFIQERIGYQNRAFRIWKFRTMQSGSEGKIDHLSADKHALRITPFGRFLRNSKIDELPQLLNVLKGEMSFVGPRPLMEIPDFNYYPQEVQKGIYNVRPGITAIGSVVFRDEGELVDQVGKAGEDAKLFLSEVVFPYKGQLEMWYNRHQSFSVDLRILFLTFWTIIFPSSQLAYKSFSGLPKRNERLRIEFDRMRELKESLTLLLIGVFALIPLVPPPFWFADNFEFILLTIFLVLGFSYALLRKDKISLHLIPSDLGWMVLVVFGFLSFLWSINTSLVWYEGFGWLSLILWMLLIRALSLKETAISLMPILFYLFFLAIMFHHVLALWIEIPFGRSWNSFFGKDADYSSCLLVSFFPFLLFYKSKILTLRILNIICTLTVIYVLTITHAKGAAVALLVVLIYHVIVFQSRRTGMILMASLVGLLVSAVVLSGTNTFTFHSIPILNQLSLDPVSTRYEMLRSSIRIFLEHPLAGIGWGNWHLEAYHYDLGSVPALNQMNDYTGFRNDNLYSRLLAELGVVGLCAFIFPIFVVLKKVLTDQKSLTEFQNAACASLLVYLTISFYYATVNFYPHHFSQIQLLAFATLGILTYNNTRTTVASKWLKGLFLIAAVSCASWFLYTKISFDEDQKNLGYVVPGKVFEEIVDLEETYLDVFGKNLLRFSYKICPVGTEYGVENE